MDHHQNKSKAILQHKIIKDKHPKLTLDKNLQNQDNLNRAKNNLKNISSLTDSFRFNNPAVTKIFILKEVTNRDICVSLKIWRLQVKIDLSVIPHCLNQGLKLHLSQAKRNNLNL